MGARKTVLFIAGATLALAVDLPSMARSPKVSEPAAVMVPLGALVERDIPFGPQDDERLDIYGGVVKGSAPVLLVLRPSGQARTSQAARSLSSQLARWLPRGYLVVSVPVRQAEPQEQAAEVARALGFVQAGGAPWGADPARVVVVGQDALARVAVQAAMDPSSLGASNAKPAAAAIAVGGRLPQPEGLSAQSVPLLLLCSSQAGACNSAMKFADGASGSGAQVTVARAEMSPRELSASLGQPGPLTSQVDAFLHTRKLP